MGHTGQKRLRGGYTLLEIIISCGIFSVAILGFVASVRVSQQGIRFQTTEAMQMRKTEAALDEMLVGMRWISQYAQAQVTGSTTVDSDALAVKFPPVYTSVAPQIMFRRINGYNGSGQYTWGNRITYYWLPSGAENSKYADGDISKFNPADIDGADHDGNGVCNDGVIWRKIEAVDAAGNPSNGPLDPLGAESFDNSPSAGAHTDLRVVMTNVPPPFTSGGVMLDSFKATLQPRSFTLTLRRFADTGKPVEPDMLPLPSGMASIAPVIANGIVKNNRPNTVAVYSLMRTFALRN